MRSNIKYKAGNITTQVLLTYFCPYGSLSQCVAFSPLPHRSDPYPPKYEMKSHPELTPSSLITYPLPINIQYELHTMTLFYILILLHLHSHNSSVAQNRWACFSIFDSNHTRFHIVLSTTNYLTKYIFSFQCNIIQLVLNINFSINISHSST